MTFFNQLMIEIDVRETETVADAVVAAVKAETKTIHL